MILKLWSALEDPETELQAKEWEINDTSVWTLSSFNLLGAKARGASFPVWGNGEEDVQFNYGRGNCGGAWSNPEEHREKKGTSHSQSTQKPTLRTSSSMLVCTTVTCVADRGKGVPSFDEMVTIVFYGSRPWRSDYERVCRHALALANTPSGRVVSTQ